MENFSQFYAAHQEDVIAEEDDSVYNQTERNISINNKGTELDNPISEDSQSLEPTSLKIIQMNNRGFSGSVELNPS